MMALRSFLHQLHSCCSEISSATLVALRLCLLNTAKRCNLEFLSRNSQKQLLKTNATSPDANKSECDIRNHGILLKRTKVCAVCCLFCLFSIIAQLIFVAVEVLATHGVGHILPSNSIDAEEFQTPDV